MTDLTYTLAELAAEFQVTPDGFRRARPGLEREGFPRRLPGFARWSKPAVEAWMRDRYRPPEGAALADPLDGLRARLAKSLSVVQGGRS